MPFAGLYKWIRNDAMKLTLPRVCALILASVVCVIYVPYLSNPLLFDDHSVINGTTFLDYALQFSASPRWLPYATLAHTYALTNGSIPAYRIGNLILHAANAIAVFVLLRTLLLAVSQRNAAANEWEGRELVVALMAALVFAAHPLAVYGTGYLIQRTILMSTLFMLLMLIAYLRWLVTGRQALWIWSAICYLLSVLSKEHSIMAPAVALLLTPLLHRPSTKLVRRMIAPLVAYTVIALLVISMVKGVLGKPYEPHAVDMMKDMAEAGVNITYTHSVLTQMYLYFKYVFLWVFPNVGKMSIDMREPLAMSIDAWPYWGAGLAFVGYIVVAISMVLRGGITGIAGWVLAFPWLMFATELSTLRIQEPFVLYRSYLWFPLLGVLVPLAIWRVKSELIVAITVPLLCVLVVLSLNRLNSLSDELLIWGDAAKLLVTGRESGAARIYYNRGLALANHGRREEALADMDSAIALRPTLDPIYYARAKIKYDLKQYAGAMRDINAAISFNPDNASLYVARAMTLKRLGRDEEAIQDLRKSCDMKDIIGCYAIRQSVDTTKH